MYNYVNSAPQVVSLGTNDLSTKQVPRNTLSYPQHLPKSYIFAQKGPAEPQLVVGAALETIFGADTFDENSQYFNHATVFVKLFNSNANTQMIQRLIPDDAGPKANAIFWMDVLPTKVQDYERNEDGSIRYDELGQPVSVGVIDGYKVKWVVTNVSTDQDVDNIGTLGIMPGDQVDPDTATQSKRYPMFAIIANFKGAAYNNSGIRLWAPTASTANNLPTKMMTTEKAYPYFLSVINRENEASTPTIVPTLFTESNITVTFKRDVTDPTTTKRLNIEEQFPSAWEDNTNTSVTAEYGDFGGIKMFYDNIDLLLGMFYEAEAPYIDEFSDFSNTGADDEKYLFNFLSGVSSLDVPYHSFQFVDSANSVRMTSYTNIFAAGGSDGTMDDQIHAELAAKQMLRYADPNDEVQEVAVNVESIMYDSGYPIETKKAMCSFISLRKDTCVVLSTYDVNDRILSQSEEYSLAVALRTYASMYPESDYFGTPVMRAVIMGRSARASNNLWTKPLPMTYSLADKASKYMGASNGRWKNGFNFDGAPGSIVDNMYDVSETFVPVTVRNVNWSVGLNWVQPYDRQSLFHPAIKTVYENDTSVLNSFETVMCICDLNKIAQAAWREFSGVSRYTNAQLADRVDKFIIAKIKDRYDDRFIIKPETGFTDNDVLRGYSWTTPIKIWAPNMKTAMTTYVQAYRLDDYSENQE